MGRGYDPKLWPSIFKDSKKNRFYFVGYSPIPQRIHEVLSLPDRPAGCRIRIGSQNLKGAHQRIVNGHHGTGVVELPTVIGCGKECDEFPPGKEFVSIFDDLMGPNQEIEIKPSQKLSHDISAVRKGNPPIVFRPTLWFIFAREWKYK